MVLPIHHESVRPAKRRRAWLLRACARQKPAPVHTAPAATRIAAPRIPLGDHLGSLAVIGDRQTSALPGATPRLCTVQVRRLINFRPSSRNRGCQRFGVVCVPRETACVHLCPTQRNSVVHVSQRGQTAGMRSTRSGERRLQYMAGKSDSPSMALTSSTLGQSGQASTMIHLEGKFVDKVASHKPYRKPGPAGPLP